MKGYRFINNSPRVLMQEGSVRQLRAGFRQLDRMQAWAAMFWGFVECRTKPSKSSLPMNT